MRDRRERQPTGAARGLPRGRGREPDLQQPVRTRDRAGLVRWEGRYAVESGELELEFDEHRVAHRNKVAQEHQIVYAVDLDEHGKLIDGQEPERVDGQYNVYDSVPGMDEYSPLWQFNYVIVPRDYEANTLPSEADCLDSGYPIEKSTIVEN